MKKTFTLFFTVLLSILILICCKKKTEIVSYGSTPGQGNALVDVSWTLDKAHCNVNWETKYFDYSSGMLTGRFNNFGFNPKFVFNEADLSTCNIKAWVQLSSVDSGEPGRDGVGKCIRSYMGVTYLDSMKTITNPASDSAWFKSTSVVRSGTGFVAYGNFSFNRYRPASGFADGTLITRPAKMYLTYNGTADFDTDGDQINDKYRASFSATLTFKRSDHIDNKSTIQWVPVPALPDQAGNTIAVNNKTYGVWTNNVADEMSFTFNTQFYKNH